MAKVRVGLVGCGFAAELHMHAYGRVYGVDAEATAVAARGDHVVDARRRIGKTYRDFSALLADREIDVVDICTPPALHGGMIVTTVQAGKHVICEKPFTGYFGRDTDLTPIGRHVPKSLMYERVIEEMAKTCAAIREMGTDSCYRHRSLLAAVGDKSRPAVSRRSDIETDHRLAENAAAAR